MDIPSLSFARLLLGAGLIGATAYLGLLGIVYSQQRRLLFPASTQQVSAAEAGLAGVQDVRIRTEDGETLVGWWKPPEPGRAVLLYFHGNGGALWNRRSRVRALTETGRGLLIVSYRGYSGSSGAPSEEGLRRDAEAAYRWLSSWEPRRIVLYGESLGTGVAVRLASQAPVGGLILDAPYTSTVDIAKGLFWYVPVSLLMRDQFRSIDRIGNIRVPLLVMHGDRDGVIPIAQSELLFTAANEPKRYLRLPGVDHVSVLEAGGLVAVERFLDGIEKELPAPP
jgi:fermentation-respiration switch protein FrsA (DUF1100 family)